MKQAPLHTFAHDLAVWLHQQVATAPAATQATGLPAAIARHSRVFVEEVALALTFKGSRPQHQRAADQALARLRVGLRLAEGIGWLTPAQIMHATTFIEPAGRILGGWQRGPSEEHAEASRD